MIEAFQDKSSVKIFFGGIKSAGIGITLTAASNVLFLDYSWVPADHEQAADRCHRIGQTAESISIYQLYAKNSIDEKMKNLLESKKAIFSKLFDEQIEEKKSINLIDDLIKEIQKEDK
jgi:SWI/SNF-related matrix-associated actin-dependent regulator 1 of chromatin subfamily A